LKRPLVLSCLPSAASDPAMKKNPDSIRAPAGLEWRLFKKLPKLTLLGLLALLALWGAAHAWPFDGDPHAWVRRLRTFDFMLAGMAIFHLTMVATVAIGCLVVMIMKGPQYTADSYPVQDAERPLE
jgi:hypothetical protein